jgi:hypothetical protein
MKGRYLLAAITFLVGPVGAQDARSVTIVQNRAAAFQAAQNVCKMLFLSNNDLATSLVKATSASLSEVCECAALLAVASKSDEQLAALVAANSLGSALQGDMKAGALECMHRE